MPIALVIIAAAAAVFIAVISSRNTNHPFLYKHIAGVCGQWGIGDSICACKSFYRGGKLSVSVYAGFDCHTIGSRSISKYYEIFI